VILRTITRFDRLFDVSPVTYPAYLDSNVALRAEAASCAAAALEQFQTNEARIASEARARELDLLRLGRR
jgi:phage head maturation protease